MSERHIVGLGGGGFSDGGDALDELGIIRAGVCRLIVRNRRT